MILEQLSLANFRGFEQLDVSFDPRITVIAGVNGVGKSGILHALAVLFCHALPEFTPARPLRLPPVFGPDDILHGRTALNASITFQSADVRIQEVGALRRIDDAQLANLDARLQEIRKEIRYVGKSDARKLRALKREESGILSAQTGSNSEFHPLVVSAPGLESLSSPRAALTALRDSESPPIAVLFTPSRQLFERPRTLPSPAPFEPVSAYLDALTERTMRLGEFMAWFNTMGKLPGKGQKRRRKVVARLKDVVARFIPEFGNIRIEEDPHLRFVVDKAGVPLSFSQLSDGERGMLAILFDITRRLAIANPSSDDPVSEGAGIALIDEIELHLHPLWQRQVLKRFSETFKGCQFVVTTHSPLVLGEVEGKSIRFLYRENGKVSSWTPDYALGLDANRILEDLMQVKSRDPVVAERITELFRTLGAEDFASARQKIEVLAQSLGANEPELTRARSLIAFLEGQE